MPTVKAEPRLSRDAKSIGLRTRSRSGASRRQKPKSAAIASSSESASGQVDRSVTRRRILLVDDHPLMREGTASCIRSSADLEVCGEAGTVSEALAAVERLKPDLVLTDLTMPGRSGLDLISDLRASHPQLPVLVLSIHDEVLHAGRALRAGARGYLMKRAGGARLLASIREILSGRIAVSPEVSTRLLEDYSGRAAPMAVSEIAQLTNREFEVFRLLGEARTNREIAEQLNLSPKTVETHRLAILRKLKMRTTAELVRYAIQFLSQESNGGVGSA